MYLVAIALRLYCGLPLSVTWSYFIVDERISMYFDRISSIPPSKSPANRDFNFWAPTSRDENEGQNANAIKKLLIYHVQMPILRLSR
jgi:hypothetical protein